MDPCYLNGEYLPLSEARVSPLDRGFLFGDGVYEMIPAYGGQPFRLAAHLERLERSLAAVKLPNPLSRADWRAVFARLLAQRDGGHASLYVQVTRGAPDDRDHAFPEDAAPTVFVMARAMPEPDRAPRRAILVDDIRWQRCDIKAVSLLPNVLLRQMAHDAGADEAILVRNGTVTEGAASNVFAVIDGTLVTPAKGPELLPGITRDLVLELAVAEGLPWAEGPISAEDLRRASEIWLTSSTKELVPVVALDGTAVGDGRPGELWRRVCRRFDEFKAACAERPPAEGTA